MLAVCGCAGRIPQEKRAAIGSDYMEIYGGNTKDIAKERLAALVKKSNQKAKNAEDRINTQADSLNKEYSNNERILQMNASGVSVKEIAKKLNMGVGEVRLVINLYKGGKQQ